MIPREILKKIRQIEIRTNRLVTENPAGVSLQVPLQFCRIARGVKNREHSKDIVLDREVDAVFLESTQTNFPGASAHSLKMFRISQRPFERKFQFQFEFASEFRTLVFIPRDCFVKFQTRSRFENDRKAHCQPKRLLRSASTCSQGMPARGFFSNSARRRSNSAACSGDKSGSNPSSKRASLSFCASSIRSASGRAFAALNNSVALMVLIYSVDSLVQWFFSRTKSANNKRQSAVSP